MTHVGSQCHSSKGVCVLLIIRLGGIICLLPVFCNYLNPRGLLVNFDIRDHQVGPLLLANSDHLEQLK